MIDKQEVKNNIEKILIYYGAIPPNGKGNWACIPSRHKNPLNNLSIKNNLCCCHCGLSGDSFNVIAEIEGLNCSDKNDFILIVKKAAEILNLDIEKNYCGGNNSYSKKDSNSNKTNLNIPNINLTSIITEYFKKTNSKTSSYVYFLKRGLNFKILEKHNIIVGNPKTIFPKEIIPGLNNIWAYNFIIPIWKNDKVVNCILRRNDWKSKDNNKTMNLKGFNVEFFNCDYLQKNNLKHLFICEGWADALTFESNGYNAIAINSIVMVNKLIESIKNNLNGFKNTKLFIAFDNDENGWGQNASKKLIEKLKQLNLNVFNLNIKKPWKDVNEYYINDKKAFLKSLKNLERIINK